MKPSEEFSLRWAPSNRVASCSNPNISGPSTRVAEEPWAVFNLLMDISPRSGWQNFSPKERDSWHTPTSTEVASLRIFHSLGYYYYFLLFCFLKKRLDLNISVCSNYTQIDARKLFFVQGCEGSPIPGPRGSPANHRKRIGSLPK